MRARSVIVALSLQLVLSGVLARAAAQEKLVVVNSSSSEASVIDPVTQEILARLPVGPQPRQVTTSPDGRFAYVASAIASQFGQVGGEAVTVLDLVRHSVVNSYTVAYQDLHDILVSRDGERLWITAEADSGIVELEAATGTVLMLWKTGGAKSHTLVATPNNRKLYVANADSDSVTVINRQSTVAGRIPTGAEPEGMDVSPRGKWLWVANRGDNTLTIINTRKDRREATLESQGEDPVRVRFRPDGFEVWVSNRTSRTVSIFDAYSREFLGSVELAIEPWDIVFSADGRKAFISAPEQNEVHVVDVDTREVIGSFYAGAQPLGMAWVGSGLKGKGTVAK